MSLKPLNDMPSPEQLREESPVSCKLAAIKLERDRELVAVIQNQTNIRQAMLSIGGIPEEVSQCEELFDLYLPVLRADFQLCETYCFTGQTIKFDFNFY